MTVEQITSIAPDDIEGFIFVCGGKNGKCRTVITVPFTPGTEIVWACPVCGENWFRDKADKVKAFEQLVYTLSEFKRPGSFFSLRFKVKTPLA